MADETVDLTLTYVNDQGDEVEYTETVTFRGLAEVLTAVERNAVTE
jgi:hypothetical protein